MGVRSASNYDELYIGGQWTPAAEHIEVTDLADGGTFASVAAATPADAEEALAAAVTAESAMRETTVVQRADWVLSIADGIEAR
ncbi:MAG: aldehyde dehydrogenase family protein, partial [Haloferacaceae archaeon]